MYTELMSECVYEFKILLQNHR